MGHSVPPRERFSPTLYSALGYAAHSFHHSLEEIEMKCVWILFFSDTDGAHIDSVFDDKVKAEAFLRGVKKKYPETFWWIQEKEVMT